jgi:hypothetical protein
MNSPNYPPPGGPQGPYGPPPGQQPPYGQRPPQTPPGGQPYGGPPPQGPPQGQPYGGPPQGQPYGAPGGGQGAFGPPGGPSGPGGAPPASYPTPPPPPAPVGKKSSTGTIIKIVLGVVVIGVVAVFAIMNWGKSASSSQAGDCIKVNTASSTNADVEKIDCNSKDAAYKVASTQDDASASCPEGNYVSYTETGSGDLLLCLTLNAKEGDCFESGTDADTRVECTDPKATFMVTKIISGTTDMAGCPGEGDKQGYAYTKPDLVQCFGPPAGTSGT